MKMFIVYSVNADSHIYIMEIDFRPNILYNSYHGKTHINDIYGLAKWISCHGIQKSQNDIAIPYGIYLIDSMFIAHFVEFCEQFPQHIHNIVWSNI